jgi:hypothetical protein
MQSKATSVAQYLSELPEDRRTALGAVRKLFLENLDPTYQEGICYGMIGYSVPHRVFPAGYHCDPRQPLPFAGLASQKGHMSLYLMGLYGDAAERARFEAAWAKTGKKLDAGKACIRFKKLDDLALDVLADTIHRMPAKKYIAAYEASLASRKTSTAKKAGERAAARAKPSSSTKRKPAASTKRKPSPKAGPGRKAR